MVPEYCSARLQAVSVRTSFRMAHDSDFECTFKRTVEIGPRALSINASAMPVSCENFVTVKNPSKSLAYGSLLTGDT